jgi:hypothetical protein
MTSRNLTTLVNDPVRVLPSRSVTHAAYGIVSKGVTCLGAQGSFLAKRDILTVLLQPSFEESNRVCAEQVAKWVEEKM